MPVELTPSGSRGGRIPKMPPWIKTIADTLGPLFFRLRGTNTVTLTTVGARSGKQHSVPLLAASDGPDSWIVIASAAGAAKHPAWYYNMARNPDKIWLQTANRKLRVQAESLSGEERQAAWQLALKSYAGYQAYEQKTDRQIPVVRLTPAPT